LAAKTLLFRHNSTTWKAGGSPGWGGEENQSQEVTGKTGKLKGYPKKKDLRRPAVKKKFPCSRQNGPGYKKKNSKGKKRQKKGDPRRSHLCEVGFLSAGEKKKTPGEPYGGSLSGAKREGKRQKKKRKESCGQPTGKGDGPQKKRNRSPWTSAGEKGGSSRRQEKHYEDHNTWIKIWGPVDVEHRQKKRGNHLSGGKTNLPPTSRVPPQKKKTKLREKSNSRKGGGKGAKPKRGRKKKPKKSWKTTERGPATQKKKSIGRDIKKNIHPERGFTGTATETAYALELKTGGKRGNRNHRKKASPQRKGGTHKNGATNVKT